MKLSVTDNMIHSQYCVNCRNVMLPIIDWKTKDIAINRLKHGLSDSLLWTKATAKQLFKPIICEQLRSGFKYPRELNNVIRAIDELNLKSELQLAASQFHVSSGSSSR